MGSILLAAGLLVLGGAAALVSAKNARWASLFGSGGAILGACVGLIPACAALAGRPVQPLRLAWGLPIGSFALALDPLSAFFVVAILGLCALAALYGAEYLQPYALRRPLGACWFFFDLLAASMLMVVVARDSVLFLIAWEVMALASYFLVTFEDEQESVRQAGWTYLVATHLGTAFLLLFFMLLARQAGTTDFSAAPVMPARLAGAAFVLALIGFGTKAGFMPMHVWLPEAHPAAPSHVSAVMSGVMIKTGIYGLMRALTLLGAPPAWWGWSLVVVGAVSGILGVLFALAQHDLKRLLAYHSVENIGIIALGLGVGLLGRAHGLPLVALLGSGGALLHVLNHALFKGLLFLGAGSVLHGAGTRDMEHLGGLLKRMPWTGTCFLVGAAAICGLPPLNGFVSEFLIYLAAFCAVVHGQALAGAVVIAALALIGGLALACFTKAFGVVFLGEPRGAGAAQAHECGLAMRLSMALLAAACVLVGLFGAVALSWSSEAVGQLAGLSPAESPALWEGALEPLHAVSAGAAVLLGLLLLAAALRAWLLRGREIGRGLTWDCGYAAPSARMQYTASSFAQPITGLFSAFLRTRERASGPEGYFPGPSAYATETPDVFHEGLYRPVFAGALKAALRLRWLQHGRIQLYVLYIALTLLVLLVWRLGCG
ncbi:MAG: proton-conducting transporter membrane subunit [Elusimicrobia bacterium]|nr:proton-conducting transporter membrane subunit [Elusimicrobiota bacterium]